MLKKRPLILFFLLLFMQCDIPEPADIVPPAVTIIYPVNGIILSANTTVVISAFDDDVVTKVWYYLDGVRIGEAKKEPYQIPLDISSLERRTNHVIQAGAVDNSSNTGYSEQITFTVAETPDIVPPTVQIMHPQGGQTVRDTVKIVAYATDDRGIQKVGFFIDGDSVGVDYSYPYSYEWNTRAYADTIETDHNIFVKAFDTGYNSAVSAVMTVTVAPDTTGN